MSDDPQTVSYSLPDELREIKNSIKDLGRDVTARFDRIEGQLATKADVAALTAVDGRVKVLEVEKATRDKAREVNQEHRQRSTESRQSRWALVVAGIAAAGTIADAIVQGIHH